MKRKQLFCSTNWWLSWEIPYSFLVFKRKEYNNIVLALRRGDLRLLRRALQEHEDQFLRSGVYLVLEKLELQVFQRLLKKMLVSYFCFWLKTYAAPSTCQKFSFRHLILSYIIQKQKDQNKAHQIKLDLIVRALKWLEIDMDVDEAECVMSILIYKNLVKGYFAHKSKVVVLSKQDPFPRLTGKAVNS